MSLKCDDCEKTIQGKTYHFDMQSLCHECLKKQADGKPTGECDECGDTFLYRDLIQGDFCRECHAEHERKNEERERRAQLRTPSPGQALLAFDLLAVINSCAHLNGCDCRELRPICEQVYAQELTHWKSLEFFDDETRKVVSK